MRGKYFEVTFYNVRVPYLTEVDLVDGRVTKEYPIEPGDFCDYRYGYHRLDV